MEDIAGTGDSLPAVCALAHRRPGEEQDACAAAAPAPGCGRRRRLW
eukprot:COSAG06_NODE_40590_length_400_cov_1.069767_1_plen_45_part_10